MTAPTPGASGPTPTSGRPVTTPLLVSRVARRAALRTTDRIAHALGRPAPSRPATEAPAALAVAASIDTTPLASRLTAYQHLVGESAGDTLPAGFLHILGFPLSTEVMTQPGFPLPILGMVHLSNTAEVSAPVELGASLDVVVRSGPFAPHRRGTTVQLVAEISTDGQVAYRGVSTYLAKGAWLFGSPPEGADTAPPTERFVAPAPTAHWQFATADSRAYAAISGDRNPIHTAALAARTFGFPRRIAHGMYAAARALALCPERRGAHDWSVEFGRPIFVPGGADVTVLPLTGGGRQVVAFGPDGARHLTVEVTKRDERPPA